MIGAKAGVGLILRRSKFRRPVESCSDQKVGRRSMTNSDHAAPLTIWLLSPYHTGSHRAWSEGYKAHSRHDVHLFTLAGRFWKWRMQGAAVELAAADGNGLPRASTRSDPGNRHDEFVRLVSSDAADFAGAVPDCPLHA